MRQISQLCAKVGDLTIKYSNLPERYIKRTMERVYWKTPKGFPQYLPKEIKRRKFYFSTARPWTAEFQTDNAPGKLRKKIFVEPIREWSFFKGDRVEVLIGRDKGKQGIVTQVIQERNWVIVEGLNTKIKFLNESEGYPGVAIQEELPLLVTTDVALVDPSDLKSTSVEWRFTESGEKVRVSTRTGRIIPMPSAAEETIDYKSRALYKNSPKDTSEEVIREITFTPTLKTFEMDIMEQMGIKEDRVPVKTYWY